LSDASDGIEMTVGITMLMIVSMTVEKVEVDRLDLEGRSGASYMDSVRNNTQASSPRVTEDFQAARRIGNINVFDSHLTVTLRKTLESTSIT